MIRRVVIAVATLLIAWLGLIAPTAGALAIPDRVELTSTSASHDHPGRVTDAISERGPPVKHDRTVSAHGAVDRWSHGASARPDGLTRPSVYAYDDTAGFASVARGSWITEERAGRATWALVAVDRPSVAAKTGTEIRKVGDVLETVDDVMANPQLLKGRHPALVENILKDTPGWQVETLGRGSAQGRGWVFRQYTDAGNPTGLQLRWHPGGGHHGPDPYWRVIGPNGDLGGIIR